MKNTPLFIYIKSHFHKRFVKICLVVVLNKLLFICIPLGVSMFNLLARGSFVFMPIGASLFLLFKQKVLPISIYKSIYANLSFFLEKYIVPLFNNIFVHNIYPIFNKIKLYIGGSFTVAGTVVSSIERESSGSFSDCSKNHESQTYRGPRPIPYYRVSQI